MAEPPRSRDVVCLVDTRGTIIGSSPKLDAHRPPGRLHLAISVVLYRSDGTVLVQQRAAEKYHFPLLWANACCSHPRPGESIADAAHGRVTEELGISVDLDPAGTFTYRATCEVSGLVEFELDHVYFGTLDAEPRPDPAEVAAVRFVEPSSLLDGTFDGVLAPWVPGVVELAQRARLDRQSLT